MVAILVLILTWLMQFLNYMASMLNWQAIDWDMKETELKNGTIDLIWNGYSVTDERKQSADFTEPYMVNEQVLVTKSPQGLILLQEWQVRP